MYSVVACSWVTPNSCRKFQQTTFITVERYCKLSVYALFAGNTQSWRLIQDTRKNSDIVLKLIDFERAHRHFFLENIVRIRSDFLKDRPIFCGLTDRYKNYRLPVQIHLLLSITDNGTRNSVIVQYRTVLSNTYY